MYPSIHVTKIQSVNFLPVIKSHLAKFTFYAENVLSYSVSGSASLVLST